MGLLYNQLYNSQAVAVKLHSQHTLCSEEREHFALLHSCSTQCKLIVFVY